jgi:hypothetical protein
LGSRRSKLGLPVHFPPPAHLAHIYCLYKPRPAPCPHNPNPHRLPLTHRRIPLPVSPGRLLPHPSRRLPPPHPSLQIRRPPPPLSPPAGASPIPPAGAVAPPHSSPPLAPHLMARSNGRTRGGGGRSGLPAPRRPGDAASTTWQRGIDDPVVRNDLAPGPPLLSLCVCVFVCMYTRRRTIASSLALAAADLGGWWCAVGVACGNDGPCASPLLSLSLCGVRRWWHGGTVVVACGGGVVTFAAAACGGGRGGPCAFFYSKKHLRRELLWPLGAHPPRGGPTALVEGSFAGCRPPRAHRRE